MSPIVAPRRRILFKCKPFDWMQPERSFMIPTPSINKEVRDRMCNADASPLDLIMRVIVKKFGSRWISLKQIYDIAAAHGVHLNPFNPWVLYTCVLTFPRAVELEDTPWGTYLPYFVMSSHSAMHEARFQVAPEFAKFVALPPAETQ
jgi:hypothetical protein